jgi:hypothetical protein
MVAVVYLESVPVAQAVSNDPFNFLDDVLWMLIYLF